jgi:hypothetical protein
MLKAVSRFSRIYYTPCKLLVKTALLYYINGLTNLSIDLSRYCYVLHCGEETLSERINAYEEDTTINLIVEVRNTIHIRLINSCSDFFRSRCHHAIDKGHLIFFQQQSQSVFNNS